METGREAAALPGHKGWQWDMLWKIQDFRFDTNTVPLANWEVPIVSSVCYLVAVWLFYLFMRDKKPMKLKLLTEIHNVILCVWSLMMCVGVLWGTVERAIELSAFSGLLCDQTFQALTMKGIMGYWCYIYYVSKFYEWGDTFLMIAKKRPLTVLHVWHHFIIVPLSWSWLYGDWLLMWYGAAFNTGIHVFMYFYYFSSSAFDHRPWWKRYLTSMQILQFFSVFVCIWWFCYYYVLDVPHLRWHTGTHASLVDYLPSLEFRRGCKGAPWVIAFAQSVNVSFLLLFINFYFQSYKGNKSKEE